MKLSTRTRYGIRALLELAINHGKGVLQTRIIAERQNISVKYLEQLMTMLKSAGFIIAVRGSKGGYTLAKPPNQIKLSDVLGVLEGPLFNGQAPQNNADNVQDIDWVLKYVWTQLQQAVDNILEAITLQDLVDKTTDRQTLNYQI